MADISSINTSGTLWRSLLTRLESLNTNYNRVPDRPDREPIDPEIDRLLERARTAEKPVFEDYYSAEKRLMPLLPSEVIETDAALKFGIAQRRNLPSAPLLQARYEAAETEPARRAVMFELTDALQYFYIKRMVTRTALVAANYRLNRLAWWLVLPTFVGLALLYLIPDISPWLQELLGYETKDKADLQARAHVHEYLSRYHLFAVMWFGLIGAYFSRLILFQQKSHELDRESLEAEFSYKSLAIRLIIGLVASIIMYLILKAEMIGGSMFPSWQNFIFVEGQQDIMARMAQKQSLLAAELSLNAEAPPIIVEMSGAELKSMMPVAETSSALGPTPPGAAEAGVSASAAELEPSNEVPLISKSFAQLLVWSLLAGFSERLIPDRFAAIEKQALDRKETD